MQFYDLEDFVSSSVSSMENEIESNSEPQEEEEDMLNYKIPITPAKEFLEENNQNNEKEKPQQ